MADPTPKPPSQPSPPLWLFATLYFCEGAPIGFIWWALPAMLRADGVAVGRGTALTALLVLPWALKFLAAPLVDCVRGPRWGWRAWIASMQIGMALSLLPLAWMHWAGFPWAEHLVWVGAALFVHAVFAAMQDASIDGAAMRSVPATQRGRVNAAMQFGFVLGRASFGGGALWFAAQAGRDVVVAAMIGCIAITLAATIRLRVPTDRATSPRRFFDLIARAARRRSTYVGLAFALTAGACFEITGALANQLLIDRGLTEADVGTFLISWVVAATVIGGLLGGWSADRWGRPAAIGVWLGLCAAAAAILAYIDTASFNTASLGALRFDGESRAYALQIGLAAMYFFYGAFTAASYAWFMDLTDVELGATQFSLYMSATNGCESWSTKAGGAWQESSGYGFAMGMGSAISFAALAAFGLLSRLARRRAPGAG
ncbi:MAG: MFS transporter [Pirellulales bacterium]